MLEPLIGYIGIYVFIVKIVLLSLLSGSAKFPHRPASQCGQWHRNACTHGWESLPNRYSAL